MIMSPRMEEAISRLTLALEELDENRRAEELQKSVGANWIKIARAMDRFRAVHQMHKCIKYLF